MKLVVGLGNPGKKYDNTRHNVGFEVLAELGRRHLQGLVQAKFQGQVADCRIAGEKAILLCPQTYMNNSGRSVKACVDFYKIEVANVLVVCDDFHLPLGKVRFRPRGSSGGQKGLQDILTLLGTEDIARLRVGIGEPAEHWNVPDYVLSKFSKAEAADVEMIVKRSANGVEDWIQSGTEFCMNQYNGL
ncbi:MAG: aminoacyl-tRNA hydrolase [Planctomycetales bacterium]|nr:aminoacyl-tRNA hydrolase [Planctomycetales bacterium]